MKFNFCENGDCGDLAASQMCTKDTKDCLNGDEMRGKMFFSCWDLVECDKLFRGTSDILFPREVRGDSKSEFFKAYPSPLRSIFLFHASPD